MYEVCRTHICILLLLKGMFICDVKDIHLRITCQLLALRIIQYQIGMVFTPQAKRQIRIIHKLNSERLKYQMALESKGKPGTLPCVLSNFRNQSWHSLSSQSYFT